jgi:hypothetical protein
MHFRFNSFYLVFAVLIMALAISVPAFASGVTLPEIDPSPIFDGVTQYLPWVFGILAIPAGIRLAINIARFIVNSLMSAFGSANG